MLFGQKFCQGLRNAFAHSGILLTGTSSSKPVSSKAFAVMWCLIIVCFTSPESLRSINCMALSTCTLGIFFSFAGKVREGSNVFTVRTVRTVRKALDGPS